jgi:hypothetical protein
VRGEQPEFLIARFSSLLRGIISGLIQLIRHLKPLHFSRQQLEACWKTNEAVSRRMFKRPNRKAGTLDAILTPQPIEP